MELTIEKLLKGIRFFKSEPAGTFEGKNIGEWKDLIAKRYGLDVNSPNFWEEAIIDVEKEEQGVLSTEETGAERAKSMPTAEEHNQAENGSRVMVATGHRTFGRTGLLGILRNPWGFIRDRFGKKRESLEVVEKVGDGQKPAEEKLLSTDNVGIYKNGVSPRTSLGGEVKPKIGRGSFRYVPGVGLQRLFSSFRSEQAKREAEAREKPRGWGVGSLGRYFQRRQAREAVVGGEITPVRSPGMKGILAGFKDRAVGGKKEAVGTPEKMAAKALGKATQAAVTGALAATPLAPLAPVIGKAAGWVVEKIGEKRVGQVKKLLEVAAKIWLGGQLVMGMALGNLASALFVKFGGILGGASLGSLVGGIAGGLIPGVGFGWGMAIGGGIGGWVMANGGIGTVAGGLGVSISGAMTTAMSLGTGLGGISSIVVVGPIVGVGIVVLVTTMTTAAAFFNPEAQAGDDLGPQLVEVVKTVNKATLTNDEAKTATVKYAITLNSSYSISPDVKFADTITVIKSTGPVKTVTRQITGDNFGATDNLALSSLGVDLSDSLVVNSISVTGYVVKDGKATAFGPITGGTTVTIGTAPAIAFSCPLVPSGGIACVSQHGPATYSCHHCDASYAGGTWGAACNFPGNFSAMDVMGQLGQAVYLPSFNGVAINWSYIRTGTDAYGQVYREFTAEGGKYKLQLHHMKADKTLDGQLSNKQLASGTVVGNLAAFPAGKSTPHSHMQIMVSGAWVAAETLLCK